jgi:2-polyprenyl-3-methyl-5-hydroxy-6-metoxy-1,4-benzoquinol methylase
MAGTVSPSPLSSAGCHNQALAYVVCNVCDQPGTLEDSTDIARVPCHVRRFSDHLFTVWRCGNCLSLHSAEDVDLGVYYAHYPFQQHKLDFHGRIGYRNRLAFLTKQGFSPSGTLLDFGCGSGVFLQFLRERRYSRVSGYDAFVPEYADRATLDRQYDAVTAYDVIEHVADPDSSLASIVRCVKPGGLLALGTPNASRIPLSQTRGAFAVELSQPYHRHILSEDALLSLVRRHGLEPLSISRRFYFDSLYPSVNTRFLWTYIHETGGMIDVCVEPPHTGAVLRSPRLWFAAFFGYFFPPPGNILLTLRRVR